MAVASNFHDRDIDRISDPAAEKGLQQDEGHKTGSDRLFRGIPGYQNDLAGLTDRGGVLNAGDLMPMNANLVAMASEYFVISLAALVILFLLYWLFKYIAKRRGNSR